jgi:hypothetical protein
MPEFLQLLETYHGAQISVQNIFGGEGRRVVPRDDPEYEHRLAEAINFIADIREGRRPVQQLREAMTTSDFPYLFGDALDRQMVAAYRAPLGPDYEWRNQYCHIGSVPDFRQVKRFSFSGLQSRMSEVKEKEAYSEAAQDEARYVYAVAKYGRKADISWEAFIDDDLGAFKSIPDAFAQAGKNTEFYEFTALWAANGTFFAAGHNNLGHGVLSEANLITGLGAMDAQTDPTGSPIMINKKYLVVPPQLQFTARKLVKSVTLVYAGGAGAAPDSYPTINILALLNLEVRINPWLPIVDASHGTTGWYLFADPADGVAVEFGYLRGYEDPQIFMKASNAMRVGGGEATPFDGDFDNDDVWYKVRCVCGGTTMDYRYAYMSDGTV